MKLGPKLVAVATATLAACSLDAMGTGAPNVETIGSTGGGEGSDTETTPTATSEARTSADSSGTSASASTGAPGGDAGSTGDAEDGVAMLVIEQAPEVDFGAVDIQSKASPRTVTVTNVGSATATALTMVAPAPFFVLESSDFGDGGDCGELLEPGHSCSIVVEADPSRFGPLASVLTIGYDGETGPASVSIDLTAIGVGTTANLLHNPGGEAQSSPPEGWNELEGDWSTTTQFARSGSRSIFAGDVDGVTGTYRLEQVIDLDAYIDAIDDHGGVRIVLSGYGRSFNGNGDEFSVRMRLLGETEESLATGATTAQIRTEWTPLGLGGDSMPGGRTLRIQLHCGMVNGDFCDAYFDDLELTLTYPIP